jgi:hypothetical protein
MEYSSGISVFKLIEKLAGVDLNGIISSYMVGQNCLVVKFTHHLFIYNTSTKKHGKLAFNQPEPIVDSVSRRLFFRHNDHIYEYVGTMVPKAIETNTNRQVELVDDIRLLVKDKNRIELWNHQTGTIIKTPPSYGDLSDLHISPKKDICFIYVGDIFKVFRAKDLGLISSAEIYLVDYGSKMIYRNSNEIIMHCYGNFYAYKIKEQTLIKLFEGVKLPFRFVTYEDLAMFIDEDRLLFSCKESYHILNFPSRTLIATYKMTNALAVLPVTPNTVLIRKKGLVEICKADDWDKVVCTIETTNEVKSVRMINHEEVLFSDNDEIVIANLKEGNVRMWWYLYFVKEK